MALSNEERMGEGGVGGGGQLGTPDPAADAGGRRIQIGEKVSIAFSLC